MRDLEGKMRAFLIAASVGLLGLSSTPGRAADLAVPPQKVAHETAPVAPAACVRWVEQTYSWYNYCEPVPNYGRRRYY
jgi:hypothetical protein